MSTAKKSETKSEKKDPVKLFTQALNSDIGSARYLPSNHDHISEVVSSLASKDGVVLGAPEWCREVDERGRLMTTISKDGKEAGKLHFYENEKALVVDFTPTEGHATIAVVSEHEPIADLADNIFLGIEKAVKPKEVRAVLVWANSDTRDWFVTVMRLDGKDEAFTHRYRDSRDIKRWLEVDHTFRDVCSYVRAGEVMEVEFGFPTDVIVKRTLEKYTTRPRGHLVKGLRDVAERQRKVAATSPLVCEGKAMLDIVADIEKVANSLELLDSYDRYAGMGFGSPFAQPLRKMMGEL